MRIARSTFANENIQRQERELARRLRTIRENAGFGQIALSKATGINDKSISSWETGSRTYSIHVRDLLILARFYQLTLMELVDVNGPPADPQVQPLRILKTPPPHAYCKPGSPRMCVDCRELERISEHGDQVLP